MTSNGGSFSHISVHVSTDWRAYCHTYDDHTPILTVDAGPSAVSISVKGRDADKAAVEFARALVHEAQVFAAEVERLHAGQAGAGDTGNDDSENKAALDAA